MERLVDVRGAPGELEKKEHRGAKRKQTQPLHDLRQGSRGLRRPKRPLSFQISGVQKDQPHPASMTDFSVSTATAADALEKRIHIIDLIMRRNRNQHRGQSFFKHLCLLRTSLARLLDVSSQLVDLSRLAVSVKSSEQVRRNFEVEASLRSQKDVLEEHIREVLVPHCYVTFSGLVGDSQFGNLGVVLVALLSEIACGGDGVGAMRIVQDDEEAVLGRSEGGRKEEQDTPSDYLGSLLGTSTRVTGEDQGEIVERMYDRGVLEGEHDMDSEAGAQTSQVVSAKEGSDGPSREETPQEDLRGTQSHGQPTGTETEDPVRVKKSSRKASREIKTEETTKRIKKSKKPKNAIDDLFSGLL